MDGVWRRINKTKATELWYFDWYKGVKESTMRIDRQAEVQGMKRAAARAHSQKAIGCLEYASGSRK